MAVKNYTATPIDTDGSAVNVSWGPMAAGDTAQPLKYQQWVDRSLQVEGTFGGATVTLGGSNSGNAYPSLTDSLGNTISMTVAGIKQVNEVTAYIKPVIAGGDGTTSLTFTITCRRTQPMFHSMPLTL